MAGLFSQIRQMFGNSQGDPTANRILELQKEYWHSNQNRIQDLYNDFQFRFKWQTAIHLHQLICAKRMKNFAKYQNTGLSDELETADENVLKKLTSSKSPFLATNARIWEGANVSGTVGKPKYVGKVLNSSLTHLGAIEAVQLDRKKQPEALTMIPLAKIKVIQFAGSGLYQSAKITYLEKDRQEIVLIPQLYGLSWFFGTDQEKTGSSTKFYCEKVLPQLGVALGIGIGSQKLVIDLPHEDSMPQVLLSRIYQIEFTEQ